MHACWIKGNHILGLQLWPSGFYLHWAQAPCSQTLHCIHVTVRSVLQGSISSEAGAS